jgi:hypothetical protein
LIGIAVDFKDVGVWVRDLILWLANIIVDEHWPGLISAFLVAALFLFMLIVWMISASRLRALKAAQILVTQKNGSADQELNLGALEASLNKSRSAPAKRLANAFSEFRETLLELGRGDNTKVRNSIRPSAFLNTDDLGYSLKGLRFVPGVFVSLGLLLTFLGLVAVLNTTQSMLNSEDSTAALQQLLRQASAKFIMSLTGLACSIALNIWLKLWSSSVERAAERLANTLERKMDFISLEGIADRQLRAIQEQTSDMKALNTHLIAELSAPLKKVSESSLENIGTLVGKLSADITSGIGGSMDTVSERMESAANSLSSIGDTLTAAAGHFETALSSSTKTLEATLARLEAVSDKLANASETVGEMAPIVLETIKEGNNANMRVAESATEMVHATKTAISEEKQVVMEAMQSINGLIEAFENRAVAYDGQLEKAFKVYQDEVGKTINRLEDHGNGVQEKFADALSTLHAVIENAKSFEPESDAEPLMQGASE